MEKQPPKFVKCKRCNRKIPEGRRSIYCSDKCKNSSGIIKKLSVDLVKEIHMLISNNKLFSDEELGHKLRSKKFTDKFNEVLFIQDKDKIDKSKGD